VNTNFGKGNHTGLDFSDNDHTESVFDAANLTDVDLSNCNLTRCSFKRAILVRTNFTDSWVEEGDDIPTMLKAARKVEDVILPDGSVLNPSGSASAAPAKGGKANGG
jgi:uncharacterized protein YjbI with pentapeptide repeats